MAVILAIAVAILSLLHTEYTPAEKACTNDLRWIALAKQQAGAKLGWDTETDCNTPEIRTILRDYMKGQDLECRFGGTISYGFYGTPPTCSLGTIASNSSHRLPANTTLDAYSETNE